MVTKQPNINSFMRFSSKNHKEESTKRNTKGGVRQTPKEKVNKTLWGKGNSSGFLAWRLISRMRTCHVTVTGRTPTGSHLLFMGLLSLPLAACHLGPPAYIRGQPLGGDRRADLGLRANWKPPRARAGAGACYRTQSYELAVDCELLNGNSQMPLAAALLLK